MSTLTPSEKKARQFDSIDKMPADLRALVHEYGYSLVHTFVEAGIRRPGLIHELVREVWEGARNTRQRRRTGGTLDWLLLQAGAEITAAELVRVLRNNNFVIVPRQVTDVMIEASLAEVSGHKILCTKRDKHKRRLEAALLAGAKQFETAVADAITRREHEEAA